MYKTWTTTCWRCYYLLPDDMQWQPRKPVVHFWILQQFKPSNCLPLSIDSLLPILQGRSVSVLNAKLSTFVTVTGQNYEGLKVVNGNCSTDFDIDTSLSWKKDGCSLSLKCEFSGILLARWRPVRHQKQPLQVYKEHCKPSGVGAVDWPTAEDIGWT